MIAETRETRENEKKYERSRRYSKNNQYTKYIIKKTIYKNTIFSVYKGYNISDYSDIIIKSETINNNDNNKNIIDHERKILEQLREIKQIPKIIDYYNESFNNYIVFNYLGKDLERLHAIKNRFSIGFCAFFMTEALFILRNIHERGVFHCDLKPSNFIFNNKENKIYLIDFSVSQIKKESMMKHDNTSCMIGTPKFCSIHCHDIIPYSERDDLISLGYVLLYFYYGYLPWQKNKLALSHINYTLNNVKNMKNELFVFLKNNDPPEEFIIYFNYCFSLELYADIDYKMLHLLFVRLLKTINYTKENLEQEIIIDINMDNMTHSRNK